MSDAAAVEEMIATAAAASAGSSSAGGSASDVATASGTIPLQSVFSVEAHNGSVKALAATANGRVLVSGGSDETIRIYDTRRMVEFGTLHRHQGMACSGRCGWLCVGLGLWVSDGMNLRFVRCYQLSCVFPRRFSVVRRK
jgi:WD40 repeat protein